MPAAQVPLFSQTRARPHRGEDQGDGTCQIFGSDAVAKWYVPQERDGEAGEGARALQCSPAFLAAYRAPDHWKLRIYNAVFVPMLVYGMESAALAQADLHRLEPFHSKALRKMHRVPATFYTRVLDTCQPTISNQQLRQQATQPPLKHYIHTGGEVG